jgi:hypothetical protein
MARTYLRGVRRRRLSASITQSGTYPNWVAGASPPPLYMSGALLPVGGMDHINYLLCIYSKEHRAVKWSTDPSRTAGTYLRNLLLPEQGEVFRQL